MKKFFILLQVTMLACILLLQTGCLKDSCRRTYTVYKPVYKTLAQVRADMRGTTPQPLTKTGKLTVYGSTIFLNEVGKGIHIIDNSNPDSPVNKGFINIPGNLEVAVKGSYLYADSYSDVAVFDISSPANITPVKFLNNVVKEKNVYWYGSTNADSILVVVDYTRKDTTIDCNSYNYLSISSTMDSRNAYTAAAPTQTGVSGSMAGFSIVGDYLYAVGSSSLYSINITDPRNPQPASTKSLGWGIETIYPFQNNLFIGSRNGVFIFDLTNPASPQQKGQFAHITRCDPVIADGQYAYSTLRGGTTCNGTTSELNVLDISNLSSPVLKGRYPLSGPYGLAKDGDFLFVCDGTAGLRVYDASSPLSLKLVKQIDGLETYDVIAFNKRMIVVAKDGLYQYDYSNPAAPSLLSKLPLTKN